MGDTPQKSVTVHPFRAWISENADLLKSLTIIGVFAQGVLAGVAFIKKWALLLDRWSWVLFFAVQVALLAFTFWWVKSKEPTTEKCAYPPPAPGEGQSETQTVQQLFTLWKWLIISWLAFYSGMLIWNILKAMNVGQDWVVIILNLLSRPYVVIYYFMYRILRAHTTGEKKITLPWDWASIIVLIATVLDTAAYLTKGKFPYGGILIQSLSSMLECVVITLFVAKLDTFIIPTHRFVIPLLYLYAGVQNLFGPASLYTEGYFAVLLVCTLVGKTLLVVFVTWMFNEGLMCHYLYWSRIIYLDAQSRLAAGKLSGNVPSTAVVKA